MADALFGADKGQYFLIRVQLDPEPLVIPVGDGPPDFRQSVCFRIPVVGRVLGRLQQLVDDGLGRGDVRVTDTEGDYIHPSSLFLRDDS